MDRASPLVEILEAHEPAGKAEAADLEAMRAFARRKADPFDRSDPEGHFTGSGLVAGPALERVVLLDHRKLGMWLQPGGHAEHGETAGVEVAIREAREETGLAVAPHPAAAGLVDVDVHEIPAGEAMPAHRHLDLRYVLVADPDRSPRPPEAEALEADWFTLDAARKLDLDPGLERLLGKVEALAPA